ncbi:hypothetical protein C1H76_7465 [Elsinoe australis]|uniref:Uncharacterized protein n=1 Tax=Elsinoe australis TaxID=40998 RepID=A0A4U7AUL5_9PEZI|nr:hypothetical protein C1H76_7465 [Elsinoe australis]
MASTHLAPPRFAGFAVKEVDEGIPIPPGQTFFTVNFEEATAAHQRDATKSSKQTGQSASAVWTSPKPSIPIGTDQSSAFVSAKLSQRKDSAADAPVEKIGSLVGGRYNLRPRNSKSQTQSTNHSVAEDRRSSRSARSKKSAKVDKASRTGTKQTNATKSSRKRRTKRQ